MYLSSVIAVTVIEDPSIGARIKRRAKESAKQFEIPPIELER